MAANENNLANDQPASDDALIGNLLDGRYLIESALGAGGMSAVYIARDLKVHGRHVVVKVLLQESFQHEYVVKKFRQEAEALSRVEHPNVIRILDYGEMAGSRPYLVLQYIEGENLRDVMNRETIELARGAQIIRMVSHALTAAHAKGILHRDLKPENVMLQSLADGEEQVIVIDFGIAKIEDSVIAPKTMVAATAGTIAYMSPEQLCAGELTPASDTYALGVLTYELITGRKPFEPKSPFQLLEMQRAGVATLPRELRPDIPVEAEAALLSALAFDAAARPASTRDFGSAFNRAVNGTPGNTSVFAATPQHTGIIPPAADANRATQSPNTGVVQGGTANYNFGNDALTDMLAMPATPTQHVQPAQQTAHALDPVNAQGIAPTPAIDAPQYHEPVAEAAASRSKLPFIAAGLLLCGVLGAGGFAAWRFTRVEPAAAPLVNTNATSSAPASNAAPVVAPTSAAVGAPIDITYSLTVQRMREGKPFREPFQSTGREIFEEGWQFRLNVSKTKPGYLYLLNEGLNDKGATAYTVLFPTEGDAALAANQTIQIPQAPQYYYFTGTAGTEKIWMVWAEQPVVEMEAIKKLVNAENQGEISDSSQIATLREFFAKQAAQNQDVTRDAAKKVTVVKTQGNILVHLAELEHQ
jgi:serine/threonine protein kinase